MPTDNSEPKTAAAEAAETASRAIADGIVKVIAENKDQPYVYIPQVRRLLDALERVTSLTSLSPSGAGADRVDYGMTGEHPVPGLRADPTVTGLKRIMEALQPVVDQVAQSSRVPALRAVLDAPQCSAEAKQRAADELSRLVVQGPANGDEAESVDPLLSDGGKAVVAEEDASVV